MPAIRSTVVRLERQIQMEQARALTTLHQAHEELTAALLAVARERGYLGAEPMGALGQLAQPSHADRRFGEAALELWRTFFACFRADEAAFEAARFQERAGEVDQAIAALPAGGWPSPELALAMLQTLSGLWEERHQAISERLDALIKDLSEHQSKLGNVSLERAHQSDELGRAIHVLGAALAELGEPAKDGEHVADLLSRLAKHYRGELTNHRRQAQESNTARRQLIDALHAAAAATGELPPLPPAEAEVLRAVRRLVDDRRQFEETVRQLRGHVARLQAEERELMAEVAHRDQRLAKYEFGAVVAGDEDERLGLYRQAFATQESGGDPKPFLEKVRRLERVITVEHKDVEQALRILDRQLAEQVKCLHELRNLTPLTDDPKRFRPRLLLGSRYDFKTLPGQSQAARDAARDLLEYLARSRWAAGVTSLSKDLPKLQRVFREMVGLVATWRDQLGDPPPASISIRLDQGNSIVALPAILATDLETVLRRKGKAAAQAAATIVPVMEECVALYHKCLLRAHGLAIPRSDGGKRESANNALLRLAGELTSLGGVLESVFGDAALKEFILDPADAALLADDHVLVLALQQLDVACDVLAVLPGAPKTDFPPLPTGRGSDKLMACGQARVTWLEEVARYRFEVRAATS